MKERPILFSGPMVRAILDGRKTQTRRVVNPQPKPLEEVQFDTYSSALVYRGDDWSSVVRCPYGGPGTKLWVRETWADTRNFVMGPLCGCLYKSDYDAEKQARMKEKYGVRWRPSIHMPRWASRITLEVTGVRVKRLQDITEEDAVKEGCDGIEPEHFLAESAVGEFRDLWDSINAPRGFGWDANPWVWVIEFKRV